VIFCFISASAIPERINIDLAYTEFTRETILKSTISTGINTNY